MDFAQIDSDEFVVYHNKVKLEKRIVQYAVFDEYDIVVLLVSNTGNWEYRDEIIAIYSNWECKDYKTLWSYQRKKSDNKPYPIHKIWKVEQDGKERVACLVNTADSYYATFVLDVETGDVVG